MRIVLAWMLIGMWAAPAAAGTYSGEWEYQALNAGDTNFQVKQVGDRITFYRVLWPLYQGKKFKLEHLYKGSLSGSTIKGEMWVREEGVKDFERLRPFTGRIRGDDSMEMDDLPLARVKTGVKTDAPAPGRPAPSGEPDRPKYAKVVIQPDARKPTDPPPAVPAPAEVEEPARKAPITIPTLVPVKRRLANAVRRKADGLLLTGDAAYADRDFSTAVADYQASFELDPRRVELLYKLGLCHGILGSKALRAGQKPAAAQHYRQAIAMWSKAVRLDPYNAGAKENIRRAKRKLAGLE